MMLFPTALVAGLVATATAFLVPPHIAEDFKDTRFRGGPPEQVKEFIHHLLEQKITTIDLACQGCSFPTSRQDAEGVKTTKWEHGVDSVIHLEFDTHDQTFNINGAPAFPFDKAQAAQSTPIRAHQIRTDTNEASLDVSLNFAMEVMPAMPSPHKDGVSLIPIDFTVLGLDGVAMKVNTISLKIIQTPTNDLVIVHTEEVPFEETPGAAECEGRSLWSLCRLRAMVMSRIESIIEASRQRASKAHGWVREKTGGCGRGRRPHGMGDKHHPHPHPHPGPMDHEHKDGHEHRHHHWHHSQHSYHHKGHHLSRMLHRTIRFFVIPALLGVIGGLTASAVGMLVGQAIVLLWFRAYRNGQRGPLRLVEREVVVDGEDDGLMSEEKKQPPAYEDAPRYEEAVTPEDEKQCAGLS